MHKFKIITAIMLLILLTTGFITQKYALACETVQFSEYKQVAANIFSSPGVENVQGVLRSIAEGKQRVGSTFGAMTASPKVVLVSTKDEAAGFGANSTASAHYTPMGTCIVLGPKGQNVDVAAHELTHAEIGHRVGWLRHLLEIPVWFNEGIALLVDHRKPFLIENIQLSQEEVKAVKKLDTSRVFFAGENIHKNYLASRLAVNEVEPSLLYEKLALIRDGASFEDVFEM
ncbi:hypothetical protein SG34_007465 [Thalassomonas viridans]|uniref:Uncharacterized protein n=1 Tax=Thalassomonas viridans TaxID=137584 RepID=A0AAF0CAC7_9GAMM|nr:hypothetical protein [Thalassomonas viridans]WDE06733.1 hypothetical protein SG34_007465 [Thalassomonas viridans]